MIEQIKAKITGEVIGTYLGSLMRCKSVEELVQPSTAMIQEIVTLVLPTMRIDYAPYVERMPQDPEDEVKDEASFDRQITVWTRALKSSI